MAEIKQNMAKEGFIVRMPPNTLLQIVQSLKFRINNYSF